jgi:hypothetical protein
MHALKAHAMLRTLASLPHSHSHDPRLQASAQYSGTPGSCARPRGRKHHSQYRSDSGKFRTRTCSIRWHPRLVWDVLRRRRCRLRHRSRVGRLPNSRNTALSASRELAASALRPSCAEGRDGDRNAPSAWTR